MQIKIYDDEGIFNINHNDELLTEIAYTQAEIDDLFEKEKNGND